MIKLIIHGVTCAYSCMCACLPCWLGEEGRYNFLSNILEN